ncbi:vacuolar protein sorting-associated protein 60.1 isoform X2 [Eucalyptus grandis]|uniref:vacuolar protein sorting-associated protein 60.1 isoform X2 n=1 Tax=Eucalyptus grandis TaxID=71139 RepID=UPI00192ED9A7|nr:vacuolar protein sorting-associated protein 60.1 isoform X2 [Eucalyptus grandis]XP_039173975.1 vacuolar protein sorting-associated protein 60.1 isoform X2 [Eucalyptus grandis]
MERAFSAKKEKEPASSSVQDASDRITRRGETIDDKIKKLDAELSRYKEQIKKMRPGPAQEAKKARAMRMLKQKRTYEGQRDMLCSESFKLDQVACAVEGIKDKDAQQNLTSLKYASKDLKGMLFLGRIYRACICKMR